MFSSLIENLPIILLGLPAVLLALSFHEMCHAFVAHKLGDPTARSLGRLTLNPFKHIDPIGFICMILFHFGWANPVPINTRYFKKPRRDMAISSAAGPLSNLLLGIISALVLRLSLFFVEKYFGEDINAVLFSLFTGSAFQVSKAFFVVAVLVMMLYLCVIINFNDAIFNLIPIPPLDGSRIFYVFLPTKWYFAVMKYERIIMIIMLALLWTGMLSGPLSWVVGGMEQGLFYLLGMGEDSTPQAVLGVIYSYIATLFSPK